MTRSRKTVLLAASFAWVLLIGLAAYLAYPAVGEIAVVREPNPFWSIRPTGIASAPFRVALDTASWLAWTLLPPALLWVVALLLGRRR